jgi:hypothetical protein
MAVSLGHAGVMASLAAALAVTIAESLKRQGLLDDAGVMGCGDVIDIAVNALEQAGEDTTLLKQWRGAIVGD